MTAEPITQLRVDHDTLPSFIPFLLSYTPRDSAVLVFLHGSKVGVTARVDLDTLVPRTQASLPDARRLLGEVAANAQAEEYVVLAYGDSVDVAFELRDLLQQAQPEGLEMLDAYFVSGERWLGLETIDAGMIDYSLVPGGHRAACCVGSREDLAKLVAGPPVEPSMNLAVDVDLDALLADPDMLDEAEALGLAALMAWDNEQYDRCILAIDRERADAWCGLWKSVVAHAPEAVSSRPLILFGISAWLTGNGALTTLAVERLEAQSCDSPMMQLLDMIVRHALPPHAWDSLVAKLRP